MKVIKDALPCIQYSTNFNRNYQQFSTYISFSVRMEGSRSECVAKRWGHEVPNNNRPVSLLTAFSKTCERVVLNQLTDYLVRHKRISKHQSGNKKMKNIFITDAILESIDNKHLTALLLLDLSKAFDSIEHNILIQKLRLIRVSKTTLEWFKSYLSDHL